ncbi:hypothetical protein Hanom_Chr09g00838191 [Helianthus anomalus]
MNLISQVKNTIIFCKSKSPYNLIHFCKSKITLIIFVFEDQKTTNQKLIPTLFGTLSLPNQHDAPVLRRSFLSSQRRLFWVHLQCRHHHHYSLL